MEYHNQRGQILTEALIAILAVVIVLFSILNNLKEAKQRTNQYGITKETKNFHSQQRSKK